MSSDFQRRPLLTCALSRVNLFLFYIPLLPKFLFHHCPDFLLLLLLLLNHENFQKKQQEGYLMGRDDLPGDA